MRTSSSGSRARGSSGFDSKRTGDVDTGACPTPWGGIVFASGRVLHAAKPDGTLLWRMQARRKCYSSPAVGDDGTVYVGSQDHFFTPFRPKARSAGASTWGRRRQQSRPFKMTAQLSWGATRGTSSPSPRKTARSGGPLAVGGFVRGAMSLARDGTVFTGTYGPTPRLVALDPAKGAVRFRFPVSGTGASEFGIHGGPVEDAAGPPLLRRPG